MKIIGTFDQIIYPPADTWGIRDALKETLEEMQASEEQECVTVEVNEYDVFLCFWDQPTQQVACINTYNNIGRIMSASQFVNPETWED